MKTKKKVIKLSESKLRNMIAESVKKVLKEISNSKGIEKIPEYALPYLINGDTDSLNNNDIEEINNWKRMARIYDVCPPEEESYFCRHPAFGEPCEVCDCLCLYEN